MLARLWDDLKPTRKLIVWRDRGDGWSALEQANDIAPEVGLDVPVRAERRSDAAEARNRGLRHSDLSASAF
jgi:hypothetical protein